MATLTNEQRIAELQLRQRLDRHLREQIPNDQARDFLADQIMRTPSGKAAVLGTIGAPSMEELAREVKATPDGARVMELVRYHEEAETSAKQTSDEARLTQIEAMANPQTRINAWREFERERGR